jgi:uncharacterized protein (TIGR02246 family)
MKKSIVAAWVDAYRRAWESNDPAGIGALFAKKARYFHTPFAEPWEGREAIVAQWLARKDEPGTTTFRCEVIATKGDTGVVRGWTQYLEPPGEYSNIWVIRFDERGRCREFTEWWVQRPQP